MKIEDQVVSVEPAKELKGLGAKQDSMWYWTWAEWNEEVEWVLIPQDKIAKLKKETFSGYTVAELGEMLPFYISTWHAALMWICTDEMSQYGISETFEAETEADARAKMLIYLIKEGIVKEKKNKNEK